MSSSSSVWSRVGWVAVGAAMAGSTLWLLQRRQRRVEAVGTPEDRKAADDAAVDETNGLTLASMNAGVKEAKYAVRGAVVVRAKELAKALREGRVTKPFKQLVFCNIGNPHALHQVPITFGRQVLALLQYLPLLDDARVASAFPSDVIARARAIAAATPGGIGAYSFSQGLEFVREHVAQFITARDGHPSSPDRIFLTAGASPGVQNTLRMLIRSKSDAILVPVPQYPLYSGTIALFGGSLVGYELSEGKTWDVQTQELRDSVAAARARGLTVRAIVVINPGNPTGNCLKLSQQQDIVKFCLRERLLLMADEVYQDNVYSGTWQSFKKVACDMGAVRDGLQLVSYHSVSKGFLGECGRRGGYMELVGIPDDVVAQFVKLASLSLCPNVVGQVMVDLMVKPPAPGDASYKRYIAERDAILDSLKRRAAKLAARLNSLDGISCAAAQGAMYVFPQITLPKRAVDAAVAEGTSPDEFYCMRLLNETGLVVVPGSGFRQHEGTWHFRCTFLPAEDLLDAVVGRLADFQARFLAEFRD